MAKPKLLNVRRFLEHIKSSCEDMLERNGKYEGGLRLPPIDISNLNEIRMLARAILLKHASKKTRKDIYVER